MAKRKKAAEPGVPEWVVTYGDLMSLLLCFFILLAAFSELKQDREFLDVIRSIQEAFGFEGGVGTVPDNDVQPDTTILIETDETNLSARDQRIVDAFTIRMQPGKATTITKIHEGTKFTIGGAVAFDAGSAVLKPEAMEDLRIVARELAGRRQRLVVRGHAFGQDGDNPDGLDYFDLGFRRAKAVRDFLRDSCEIDARVMSCESRGNTEPAEIRRYTAEEQAVNRRVEIILTEELINETNPGLDFTDASPIQGS